MRLRPGIFIAAAAAICVLVSATTAAQSTFKRPIKVIVPYAPGGGADLGARLLAPGLSKALGQNIIIENRTGASGQIGAQAVQGAAPDGTTLLFTVDHPLTIVPLTPPGVNYDPNVDFVSLGTAFRSAWTLTVPPNAPYQDFKQYAAAVKQDPKLRSLGVSLLGGAPGAVAEGIGAYLGVEIVQVPFAGSAPVIQNVMGGQIPAGSTGMPDAVKVHKSGTGKIIALTGPARSEILPDVPTFKELGVPGLEPVRTFIGYFAPKGLPPAMAQEFNAALRKVLAQPEIHAQLLEMSLEPASTTLEEAAQEMDQAVRFWKARLSPKR